MSQARGDAAVHTKLRRTVDAKPLPREEQCHHQARRARASDRDRREHSHTDFKNSYSAVASTTLTA
jgi:hypothetical protein